MKPTNGVFGIDSTELEKAKQAGTESLAGLYFRKYIEEETKNHGNGQAAPAQILTDFIANQDSSELPKTSYTPGVVPSRLDKWLPEHISKRLIQGFKNFDKFMKGFVYNRYFFERLSDFSYFFNCFFAS